ncbi:hypothetical protein HanPSC8_Chr03g0087671 [Helianthus annuus]|nr:hypothetical protein HanPSC8_Chr03g0087671 [Helianthus annuus]
MVSLKPHSKTRIISESSSQKPRREATFGCLQLLSISISAKKSFGVFSSSYKRLIIILLFGSWPLFSPSIAHKPSLSKWFSSVLYTLLYNQLVQFLSAKLSVANFI